MEINNNKVSVLGLPLDLGASRFGARLGPEAIRLAGLCADLKSLGFEVEDLGDLNFEKFYERKENKYNLTNIDEIAPTIEMSLEALWPLYKSGVFPISLGGDHCLALATIQAFVDSVDSPGIIYIDAHADINTKETSPSGNIHGMGVAGLLKLTDDILSSFGKTRGKLRPENIVYLGLHDLDPGEVKILADLKIPTYTIDDWKALGTEKMIDKALKDLEGVNQIHLSFDVDACYPSVAPGTGILLPDGLTKDQALDAFKLLGQCDKVVSMDLVEVNPLLDLKGQTSKLAKDLILSFFAQRQA